MHTRTSIAPAHLRLPRRNENRRSIPGLAPRRQIVTSTWAAALRSPFLAFLLQTLLATPALAGEPFKPTVDFSDMRIVVRYVSTGELAKLQSLGNIDLRDIRQGARHGFSILRRSRATGTLTCEIYLPNEQLPREVDGEATMSLGHELLHCMRGDYHR
jgi:hypothetical protein